MKDFIVSIQTLLTGRNADFDKAVKANRVKLVRQKDSRNEVIIRGRKVDDFSLYEMYKHDRTSFLHYQGEQVKPIFHNVDYIVAFLGESSREARFIGVYENKGLLDIKFSDDESYNYDFREVEDFDILKEKVIIEWGESAVSWHQYISNIKNVVRIERGLADADGTPYFSSYNDVNLTFEQLQRIIQSEPEEWKASLKAVNCIYMIVDKNNGKQYIGSTYANTGGIWQRWSEYAQTGGHGGNRQLEALLSEKGSSYASNFSWIVLETLSLKITPKEAVKRESLYKDKFLTRQFGYNDN